MLRLDKYLADMGCGTRQEVKKYIRQGRICVDGEVVKKPEQKVDEVTQRVSFDGKELGYAQFEYYMLHKPAGVISATEDAKDQTVIDLIVNKKRKDLFPVGRLDKDTEGLLLITNDGDLAHRLLSPKKHVDKCYYAKVEGHVTAETVKAFAEGVNIGTEEKEEWTMPGKLEILNVIPAETQTDIAKEAVTVETECSGYISEIHLTIQEGKFHQVKRMFQAVGMEVLYLKRMTMGPLRLDEMLAKGAYRSLTEQELKELKNL